MSSIDYTTDIERIISILESNSILKDEIKSFQFGEANYLKYDEDAPYIIVTVPNRPFLTRDQFGLGDGSVDSQHSIQFTIKIIVDTNFSENSERALFRYIKEITDTLKANPRLKNPLEDPVGPPIIPADPKCIRSFLFEIQNDANKRGQEIQIASIGLQCQLGSEFTLDIAGFSGLPLISKPVENEIDVNENLFNKERIRKGLAPILETHSFFAELEYVEAVVSALRIQKRNRAIISTTLSRPSGDTVYSGKLTEISNSANSDQIETVIIRFEVIH